MQNASFILGLDIGGTKTGCIVGTFHGEILARKEFATVAERKSEEIFSDIRECIRSLLHDFSVSAISVSIGGPIDLATGTLITPPHLPSWNNFPLKERLQDSFRLPVYIEHDGNAGALAEWYFGHGRGLENLVFITHGTGFGAGIILNGRLYRGSSSLAGEIGHIRIADDGPEAFGKKGSAESFCGGLGIKLLARKMYPALYSSTPEAKQVIEDYHAGRSEAIHVIKTSAKYTGKALAVILDLLNPRLIVLGSLSHRLGDEYMHLVRESARKESLERAFSVCRIEKTSFGINVGDYASLMAAIYSANQKKDS